MRCPHCTRDNAPGAVTCRDCNVPLEGLVGPFLLPPGALLDGGKYRIDACVGQGGFGITYIGSDVNLNRPVAIKEFFPQGSTRRATKVVANSTATAKFQEDRQHFLEEGRKLAQFDHPSIVRVYSAFAENETAYIVMEFIRGRSLEHVVQERGGRLPEEEAIAYVSQVAEGLEVVHKASILHRDIKPDNIMVTGRGPGVGGRVVLIDFGAARQFVPGVSQKLTVVLTRGYAPPEQYRSKRKRGPFTDVYSLAAVLYRLLTGEVPYDAQIREGEDAEELPEVRSLNSTISGGVARVVMQSLAMDAEARPQTVREFLNLLATGPKALIPLQVGLETGQSPIIPSGMTIRPTYLTAFPGSPALREASRPTVTDPAEPVTDSKVAPQRPWLPGAVAVGVIGLVSAVYLGLPGTKAPLAVSSPASPTPTTPATQGALPSSTPTPPSLEKMSLEERLHQGEVQWAAKEYEGAEAAYGQAIALDPHNQQAYYHRGRAREERGNFQAALADFDKAAELDPKDASPYIERGLVKAIQGRQKEALDDYTQAIKLNPEEAAAPYDRGGLLLTMRQPKKALDDYERAVRLNPQSADYLFGRGLAKEALEDPQAALADYSEAIRIDPGYSSAYVNRGLIKKKRGDLKGAMEDYDRAVPGDPLGFYDRAIVKELQGDKQGALADYTKYIELIPADKDGYLRRADLLEALGEKEKAAADRLKAQEL